MFSLHSNRLKSRYEEWAAPLACTSLRSSPACRVQPAGGALLRPEIILSSKTVPSAGGAGVDRREAQQIAHAFRLGRGGRGGRRKGRPGDARARDNIHGAGANRRGAGSGNRMRRRGRGCHSFRGGGNASCLPRERSRRTAQGQRRASCQQRAATNELPHYRLLLLPRICPL